MNSKHYGNCHQLLTTFVGMVPAKL